MFEARAGGASSALVRVARCLGSAPRPVSVERDPDLARPLLSALARRGSIPTRSRPTPIRLRLPHPLRFGASRSSGIQISHGRVRPDAKGEREHGQRGEPAGAPQSPAREPEIHGEVFGRTGHTPAAGGFCSRQVSMVVLDGRHDGKVGTVSCRLAPGPSLLVRVRTRNQERGTRNQMNYVLSISRAITRRWISLVPSPMVHSFESRKNFSAG